MFSSSDLIWIDFEDASASDLKASGTFRYASDASTRAIVLAYAIGDAPALTWHADGAILDWNNAPDDLRAAFNRGMTSAAWNAGFDSATWNYATLGFPFLAPERVIDPMIQASVSNLPTDLESASRALGGAGKQKDGKRLIKMFCVEGADPRDHPEDWQRFLAYARQDVEAMRDVYRRMDAPAAARGMAAVLGVRTHQPPGRDARHALRAPRSGFGDRGRYRYWPPAGRVDR
jgi:DNA polymerase